MPYTRPKEMRILPRSSPKRFEAEFHIKTLGNNEQPSLTGQSIIHGSRIQKYILVDWNIIYVYPPPALPLPLSSSGHYVQRISCSLKITRLSRFFLVNPCLLEVEDWWFPAYRKTPQHSRRLPTTTTHIIHNGRDSSYSSSIFFVVAHNRATGLCYTNLQILSILLWGSGRSTKRRSKWESRLHEAKQTNNEEGRNLSRKLARNNGYNRNTNITTSSFLCDVFCTCRINVPGPRRLCLLLICSIFTAW